MVAAHKASNRDTVTSNMEVENDAIEVLEELMHRAHTDMTSCYAQR